jgi:hypothetical protein
VLRISINETPTERRWILQGRLVGPWVAEVRTSWKKTHRDDDGRTCIIDLCDVTFIDKGGENLLRSIAPLSCTQASSERPTTNAVQGWTVELNATNQRWGITAPSFFLKSKKEQHRAS